MPTENQSFNAFTDILGRRLRDFNGKENIVQHQIKKGGVFDASVVTRKNGVLQNLKYRRSVNKL